MIPPLHSIPSLVSLAKMGVSATRAFASSTVGTDLSSSTAMAAVCVLGESVLAKALVYDPATRHKLQYLKGKVLSLRLTSPDVQLFVGVSETAVDGQYFITLTQHCETVATELSGRCWDVLNLLKTPPVSLANTGVQVRGSTALLQQWMAIFHGLDIDWEDAIIQQLGSLSGHQLAEVLRLLMRSEERHRRQFMALTARFLADEAEHTPHRETFAAFQANIQRLREDVSQWVVNTTTPRS